MFPFEVGITFLEHASGIIWRIDVLRKTSLRLLATNNPGRKPVEDFPLSSLKSFLREKKITILGNIESTTIEKIVLRRKSPRVETGK